MATLPVRSIRGSPRFFAEARQRAPASAAYLIGHGMTNVQSLAGGIDAWSCEVDQTLPRYRLEVE